jgi:DNA repair protein RadC
MKIKEWPRDERPREKLLKHGAATLSDAELMAIIIRNGFKGRNGFKQTALDISHELFIQLGSWNNIMTSDSKLFCEIPGLGITKYVELQTVNEIGRRCAKEPLTVNNVLKDTQATYRYLVAKMKDYRREVFACLFLNSAHHLISFQELFYGTVNMSSVHPREIVKAALECNAVGVIAVHNHPSGQVKPSEADIQVTYHLKQALALFEISLLDHVIIGKGGAVSSFIEQGLL